MLDSYPAVKKESCLCAIELACATKKHFHMVAEILIEPLLKTTKHHQSPIRYTAIQSLSNYINLIYIKMYIYMYIWNVFV